MKTLIIGGGLAGLGAGFHLEDIGPEIFEAEDTVGGLCRSFTQDRFTFDVTGHLLHLKDPYTRALVDQLLPSVFQPHERRAAIYSKSVTTPYPFQANTFGLPTDVVKDCLLGFVETLGTNNGDSRNFHEWILSTFGSGIAEHFMLPFNEKFWKRDLREITADWVSWSIPKPSIEEVVNGALGVTNEGMGYNPRFLYPQAGGIDQLPQALARSLRVHNNHTATLIDANKGFVRFENGREERFDFLISTIPLPLTFKLLTDCPDALRMAAEGLQAISVLNLNIGINRPNISDKHWIYFPENKFIFSRVGFPMNFSQTAGPPGTTSLYIEITHDPSTPPNTEQAFEESIRGLIEAGLLRAEDEVLTRHVIDVRHAYVVFDQHRQQNLARLIQYLEANRIFTAGRYGQWDYYSMEDSILSGKSAAELVIRKRRSLIA